MKIQSSKQNLTFGNQYAVYERTARQGLKPLGTKKVIRETINNLLRPIGEIKQGDGLFVFTKGAVSADKSTITLSGLHVPAQRRDGLSHLSYDGAGSPVQITFPRVAEPKSIQQKVLNFLKNNFGLN